MIKINLCPIDELDNQYWYMPELAAALALLVAGYAGVQYYFGTIEEATATVQAETAEKTEGYNRLAPDLERFKTLGANIQELQRKIQALQSITVSKVARYKPVIATEHFQNLKPEGVWFESFKIGSKESDNSFELKGQAFDNLLVAEFMMALRATESQEKDDSDLRTQVYFAKLDLEETTLQKGMDQNPVFPDLKPSPQFTITGGLSERGGTGFAPPTAPTAPGAAPQPATPPPPQLDVSEAEDDSETTTF